MAARASMEALRENFPGRLIWLRGDIPWPARSPALFPCDYFPWGGYLEVTENWRTERFCHEIALMNWWALQNFKLFWFSLFKGISTFVGYLIPKPSFRRTVGVLFKGWFNQQDPVDELHFGRPWCQRHGSGRVCLISGLITSSLRGSSSLALTLLEGVRFIAWRLRCSFLGNC